MKDYYKAYDERYKEVHKKNLLWEYDDPTKEISDIINKYNISKKDKILDLGCGEGRDTIYLLNKGYNVLGVDYSKEAIKKCNELTNNKYCNNFKQFDLIQDKTSEKFKFIYSMSVIHMFVLEEHRNKFFKFIYDHLEDDGIAFITSMGNGKEESKSDITKAFDKVEKTVQKSNVKVKVANTSCMKVSWNKLLEEIDNNDLMVVDKFLSEEIPGFNISMCAIVKKKNVKKNLELYVPKLEDYWYEQKLNEDEKTMSYNAGYDVSYYGYHYDTGCIDFPKERWKIKYDKRKQENMFFAYIKDISLNKYVGYCNYYYNSDSNRYECGILIEYKYRKKGYSKSALKLLCETAFKNGIKKLYDNFEKDRDNNTLKLFKEVGFKVVEELKWKKFNKCVNGVLVCITKGNLLEG